MSEFSTALTKVNDTFFPMIERQLTGNGIKMDEYSKQCVLNAISAINTVLDSKSITWNDEQLDRNNITMILLSVASLKLNPAANPREVFFQLRNVKIKKGDKDIWKKQIEMGIEGDGNDAILARFGRGVKEVRQFWLVREGDEFEYPKYNGLEMEPPKWTPTGRGDVVRVVYPIIKNSDITEYYISERDDVSRNLIAHINNNLMNETFGVCSDRYNASFEQKKQIAIKKAEVLKQAKELGLDALDDPELQMWISPAWSEYHSRESMLIRKMRNNVVKRIPKDFGSAFVEMIHSETTDDTYASTRREVAENANGVIIDVQPEVRPDPVPDPITEPPGEPEPSKPEPPYNVAQQDIFSGHQQAAAAGGPGF